MRKDAFKRAAAATRSGIRRYPRHLWESLRDASAPPRSSTDALRAISNAVGGLEAFTVHPGVSAVWLGHATVLLRVAGLNILTDPVFSHRIGVSLGRHTVGVSRMSPPPLDVPHLPPIDLILISHAHFDHLDRPSLRRLINPRTTVITARRTARLIPRGFRDVIELDWDATLPIPSSFAPAGATWKNAGIEISAWQPRHWGARTALDRVRGFNSYVITTPAGVAGAAPYSILFAGDTAHTDTLAAARPIDLAIFGIGAYDPWDHAHATPEQVWEMFRRVARDERSRLLPIHHSTFELSDEPAEEPMKRLLAAAGELGDVIACREVGAIWNER